MAKQVITKLLDDLDGTEADETVSFAFDGSQYTIDLSAKNAAEFRELMSKYQDAGERTGRMGTPAQLRPYNRTGSGSTVTHAQNREMNGKIRRWAEANGYELSDRGRIPQHIVDAYESGTPNPAHVDNQAKAQAVEAEITRPGASAKSTRPAKKAATATFSGARR